MFYIIEKYVIIIKYKSKKIGGVGMSQDSWALRLVLIPIKILKYISLGLFFTLYYFISVCFEIFGSLLRYILRGFIVISYFFYQMLEQTIIYFPMYVGIGFIFVLFQLSRLCSHIGQSIYKTFVRGFEFVYEKMEEAKKKEALAKEEKLKKKKMDDTALKSLAVPMESKPRSSAKTEDVAVVNKEDKKKKKEKDVFINEKEKMEKKSLGQKLKIALSYLSPITWAKALKKSYDNTSVIRYIRNKREIDREALLLNFEGSDAEKSDTKILYEYVAKDADGKIVKDYFEAYSKVEVHSFLLSEGMTVYKIRTNKWITFLHGNQASAKVKIKNKDLIFLLTQLSTYLKAGITLVEALKILSRQYKNKKYKKVFRNVIYDLTMGDNFSTALEKRGDVFPRLLINMIKTSEMTGELPEVLDDMAEHYSKIDKTRKEMINALLYPALVFIVSIVVIIFIMLFVIPQFVQIYESMDSSVIPSFTLFIIKLSNFLKRNILWIILIVIVILFALYEIYKRVRTFKTAVQWFTMHLPVFGNVIIYNEVTMFTKTLSSLLKHNVPISESMEILNKMTNNEVYKMLILNTITNIYKGDKISEAFKGQWAFPIPAYEMIVTGERTGELPEMMEKVATYYQTLQETSVTRIKTFIEPILIIFLTVIVGIIVLAIIIPMFNMYSAIQ